MSEPKLDDAFVADVVERLREGKRVRRTLPDHGRLNVDRPLPFLAVFRHPRGAYDGDTRRFVAGEASYLVPPRAPKHRPGIQKLIRALISVQRERFGAFCIVELWAGPDGSGAPGLAPGFRILPAAGTPRRTVTALHEALRDVRVAGLDAVVEMGPGRPAPPGAVPLLKQRDLTELGCALIGLEVRPIHRDPETGEPYPFVRRELHRGIARALRRAFFEFSRAQTSHRPRSPLALGKRAIVKAVYDADHGLAEVSYGFDFLLQVTPMNTERAWAAFRRARFEREPEFVYRPRPVDPAALKRKLYAVPIARVEDPTLAALLRDKRRELDIQLGLITDLGTPNFLWGSLQLFGRPDHDLIALATALLDRIPPRVRDAGQGPALRARDVAKLAREEIDRYRDVDPDLTAGVEIRDDVNGLLVSRGNVLVGADVRIPASRVEALLQHEIGIHALTYHNGKRQPLRLMRSGLPGYEELQEGLAVLAEYLVGGLSRRRLRTLALRVAAVASVCDGASFLDTFRLLHVTHGADQRSAFVTAMRVHRGGGFTKDAVYLRGLHRLVEHLAAGGRLDDLLVGKVTLDSLDVVEELLARRVLQPPTLRPRFLDEDGDSAARLDRVRAKPDILSLVEVRKR